MTYVIPCTLHTSFMLTQTCTYSVDNEVDNWGIGSFLRRPQFRLFWGVEEVQCLDVLLTCCLITIRGEERGGKEGEEKDRGGRGREGGKEGRGDKGREKERERKKGGEEGKERERERGRG